MKTKFQIMLFLILLIGLSCHEQPPEPAHGNLELTAEDIGVKDVVIRIKCTVTHSPWFLTITMDDHLSIWHKRVEYASFDTTYLFMGLEPSCTHCFKAYYEIGETVIDSSEPLYVRLMDTTSHDFTWDLDTLGDGISNHLYDVAIINDLYFYAVGKIYKRDSTGDLETEHYGLARWNAGEWELKKLKVLTPKGFYSNMSPDGIFAFSSTDVWIANGDMHHFNGDSIDKSYWLSDWIGNPNPILPPGQFLKKLWGTSSDNLYAVGTKGVIAHFNGTMWQLLESGTDVDITDIYGSTNSKTGETEVLAVGYNSSSSPTQHRILKISGETVENLPDISTAGMLTGVWFDAGIRYYVTGIDIWYIKRLDDTTWYSEGIDNEYYSKRIRGNRFNDLIIAGDFGNIAHFNGYRWNNFIQETDIGYGTYWRVAMRGDMIVAVGDSYGSGVVAIGRR